MNLKSLSLQLFPALMLLFVGCSGDAAAPLSTYTPAATPIVGEPTLTLPTASTPASTFVPPRETIRQVRVDFTSTSHWWDQDWGQLWKPQPTVTSCAQQSKFAPGQLSSEGRVNLEQITGKSIEDIRAVDLHNIVQLNFSNFERDSILRAGGLISYDGLEYLTCLQWLDMGAQDFGRDHRFLEAFTELRYLNLEGIATFQNVDTLRFMKKLEYLVLPNEFKRLPDLAQFTSLQRISAPWSRTCDITPLLEMVKLESLLLKDSDYHLSNKLIEPNRNFDVSADPTGKYLELLIEGGAVAFNPEFDTENLSGIHSRQYMMELVQSLYKTVGDNYDAILFIGNAETSDATYMGQSSQISNSIDGLGVPVWSSSDCFGSAGRLKGLISFPALDSLWTQPEGSNIAYGSLIHEILHLWGGGDLLPRVETMDGNISGGHWGISSANGLLGGFDSDSLNMIENNVYRTNFFFGSGNPGLDLSLSAIELYMMGVLPASDVPNTTVFHGVSQVDSDNTCSDYGYEPWDGTCFRATKKKVVPVSEIIDVFGERPYEGKVEIALLIVAISEKPLTESDWSRLDEHVSWYIEPSTNGDLTNNNMWEASDGKIRLTVPFLFK
ncbi:hypothetical protein N9517_06190 [Candidatus Pelagibacter sp.]|nr:hypothetical protein [Candidatus Pelagibacter sp.]